MAELDLADLADRLAIRRLVEDYARAADRVDGAAAGACFADDGVLRICNRGQAEPARVRNGPEEIATAFAGLGRYDVTLHVVANHYVELDGDTGTGETYCLAHHIHDADDGGTKLDHVMAIRYLDQYRRTDGGWKLAVRELQVEFTEDRPVSGP
jgi:ketosteroid isomerase-like protein